MGIAALNAILRGCAQAAQRGGLDKLIGSTKEHILYQVPCSILAVRA
jgi:nucleotide-binding universal stress UspA family protein